MATKPCSDCGEPTNPLRRGRCGTCYKRFMYQNPGTPSVIPDRKSSAIERVNWHGWDPVQRVAGLTECWEYRGPRQHQGYGVLQYQSKTVMAHRAVHEHHNGTIEAGLVVMHLCDNPPCVNPDHLRAGTVQDNVDDKMQKGRFKPSRGSANGSSKLTEKQVLDLFSRKDVPSRVLEAEYGISNEAVRQIRNGERWGWLTHG